MKMNIDNYVTNLQSAATYHINYSEYYKEHLFLIFSQIDAIHAGKARRTLVAKQTILIYF